MSLCVSERAVKLKASAASFIHVPPCAWIAVTRSCQQRILERDGTGYAEGTLQGPLASVGLWVGPALG